MDRKEHWNRVYQTKATDDVSWFQTRPAISLKLIHATGTDKDRGIIDVGGGVTFVPHLFELLTALSRVEDECDFTHVPRFALPGQPPKSSRRVLEKPAAKVASCLL